MLNELIEKNPGGFYSTFSNELGQIYFIWVEDKDDVPTLVHEIYHMINSIFEDREVHHGLQNQETFAYYLSYWTKKFINSSKKKKKK
jgi:oligoendopeptidase F